VLMISSHMAPMAKRAEKSLMPISAIGTSNSS
jgi:hypothetical protein